jgi:dTDP-4-dehydrorhamnose reductase
MKATVIGANGQLGSDLVAELTRRGVDTAALTHGEIIVEDANSVRHVLRSSKPDVVLNTAAFHVVPKCEEDPVRAYQVNSLGALNVARVCNEIGALAVYYSTDYVFDGGKSTPYTEDDRPNPLNVYASTKLLGENYTLNYALKSLVFRVSGIYGRVPCRAKGANFVTTMIKAAKEKAEVRVVTDEVLSPTPTVEIARKSLEVIAGGYQGLFHLVSEGACSWYEFARVIFETLHLSTPLLPSSVKDTPPLVKRPHYSALENKRLRECGFLPMPRWDECLIRFLQESDLVN